jgi:hypothetical protein
VGRRAVQPDTPRPLPLSVSLSLQNVPHTEREMVQIRNGAYEMYLLFFGALLHGNLQYVRNVACFLTVTLPYDARYITMHVV